MNEYFLVVKSDPRDESFIRVVNEAVEAMVVILRSVFLYDHSETRSETLTEHHWREQVDNGVTVTLVDDLAMPGRYLYFAGGESKQRERVWKNVAVMLPVIPVAELRRDAVAFENDPGALQRLALAMSSEFDQDAFDVIVGALASTNLEVRMSAAAAASLTRWREFVPGLEAALRRESTDDGKRALAHVISVLAHK